jgi:hypothetical protein
MTASRLVLSLFIVAVFAACASGRSVRADDDIVRFFDDVAFGGRADAPVVKWTKPPTVRLETLDFSGQGDEAQRSARAVETDPKLYAALQAQVARLAELTALPMRLMPRDIGEGGTMVVTIVPRVLMRTLDYPGVPERLLQQQMGPSRCFFLIWPNKDYSIRKVRIVINKQLDQDHIKHCFIEELTQSMGLPNDSDRIGPSIFNERLMLDGMSPLDRLLVTTLYDPRVPVGAQAGDVMPLIADLLRGDVLPKPD